MGFQSKLSLFYIEIAIEIKQTTAKQIAKLFQIEKHMDCCFAISNLTKE